MPQISIHAGLFRQVFAFENVVKTATTSGGFTERYERFYSARGCFIQKSGDRNFDQGQDMLVEGYDFYCYWRSALEANINKDTRITYDNKSFRIDRKERMQENHQYYHFEIVAVY